MYHYVKTFRT